DGCEGAEFQPVFQFALDEIEAFGGDAVRREFTEGCPVLRAQIPERGSDFFARAARQLFQVEDRKPGRFMGVGHLAIEETKQRQPAILAAPDAIEEFTAAQAESRRAPAVLAQKVILFAVILIGKSLVGL